MDNKEKYVENYIKEQITELPNLLNNKLLSDSSKNNKLESRTELKTVLDYVDNFLSNKPTNRFIVLPGLRGVGKTTILYQVYDYLLKQKNIPPKQILYLSCDVLNNLAPCNIMEAIELYLKNEFDSTILTLDKKVILLIDEAQYDKKWSLIGKIIFDRTENIFTIFTGSSALELEYNADSTRRMLKKFITPLNYTEHLKLKYNLKFENATSALENLIFTGDITDAVKEEKIVNDTLTNTIQYSTKDWNTFLKFGGFPSSYLESDNNIILQKLSDNCNKIINTDLLNFKSLSLENQANARRILAFIALQEPGEISQNKLANYLRTSSANINSIMDILEKTQLIFSCKPYGGAARRIKKAWKYYFATASIHNALSKEYGNPMTNTSEFEGVLIENMVASTLFNLNNRNNFNKFNLYYDSNKKNNVDFLIHQEFDRVTPVEVGRGNKTKKQVLNAMNRYDSKHGIIVSNTTRTITKDDEIIYMPFKTFALL